MRNFEIKVRGPFDLSDRMSQPSSPSINIKAPSIMSSPSLSAYTENKQHSLYGGISRGNSIHHSAIGNINHGGSILLDGRSGILLNKEREDLCWDHLFMVCGGTGITPMLQLVSYRFLFYYILFYYLII
jgi:hypothetical protein